VTRFIGLDEVIELHRLLIEQTGGMPGIRDLGLLESAVAQPQMTFGGQELYPSIADKAAALCFSLVMNHPFVDGNKRIGQAAMEVFLVVNGHELDCPVAEQEDEILGLAAGEVKREQFTTWLHKKVVPFGGTLERTADDKSQAATGATPLVSCPDFIHQNRVVRFTVIDRRHHHTRKTRHFIGGTMIGPASAVAICEYENGGYLLFSCDENWQPRTDTWHQSLEDAMRQAEYEYEGVSRTWQDRP
jgi:death on curing protein